MLYKYGYVRRQMHGKSRLQWLDLQTEQSFSEVLSKDVKLSIYFRFKVLNTLYNNMSRIFRIVLYIVYLHARKLACFSLCNIIKIYVFVF